MEPVSTSEFQSAIGELRRRSDERHAENITRMSALETEFRAHTLEDVRALAGLDKAISQNTDLTRAALLASTETKTAVQGILDTVSAARTGRKFLVAAAAVVVALSAMYGAIMYVFGKGPWPGFNL